MVDATDWATGDQTSKGMRVRRGLEPVASGNQPPAIWGMMNTSLPGAIGSSSASW
jgi:hypothetical protein